MAKEGFHTERSFRGGKPTSYGEKDSVRPDFYKEGTSVDVKNYDLQTELGRNNLARDAAEQARGRVDHLPPGTVQQVIIDVRGQDVSHDVLRGVASELINRSNGALKAENIKFLR
jgi:hypothetical protein